MPAQDPSGDIALNAKLINRGRAPEHLRAFTDVPAMLRAARSDGSDGARPSGCVMVHAADEVSASELISGGVLDWLQSSGFSLREDVQVLSPMKRGAAGTIALNRRLKQRLNPPPTPARSESGAGQGQGEAADGAPGEGDSMIQLTNDYENNVFHRPHAQCPPTPVHTSPRRTADSVHRV